jgi:hypothetical protein
MIDQFIAAGEQMAAHEWTGLLLPHGYEGQGTRTQQRTNGEVFTNVRGYSYYQHHYFGKLFHAMSASWPGLSGSHW